MNRLLSDELLIRPATADDQSAALALLFSRLAPADCARHVQQAVSMAAGGNVEGLWVGYHQQRLAATALVQIQPGRTASVSPPRVAEGQPAGFAARILAHALADLENRNVCMAQALLELDHGPDAQLLRDAGFRHVSNLLYLACLRSAFPTTPPQDGLEFTAYRQTAHDRFAQIVERTYAGSLDCPEIDGVRKLDDVIAGYRATGVFDPDRWVIACFGTADVGCVLLTEHPRNSQWELMYMGVAPEFRGRSFGVAIVRHALWLARAAGTAQLVVLAVDAANAPAIAMYAAAGFTTWDHRSVFLRVL